MTWKLGEKVAYDDKVWLIRKIWSDGDLSLENVEYRYDTEIVDQDDVERIEVKVSKAATASNKLGIFGKGLLTVKLKLPQGTTLTDTEANYVIDGWESQKTVVKTRQNDMASVSDKIDRHLSKLGQQIPEAIKELREARANYKKCKDPIAKRKWARKVVVRAAYYEQVRGSQHSLVSTVERVKDAVDDAQYIYKTLESRIAEARIYRELNGGLKLVGKSLMEAKTKHIMPELEYNNLEVSMEALEAMAAGKADDQLLLEAETIVNDKERWATNEATN